MEKAPYPKFVNKAKKVDRSPEIRPGPLSLGKEFAVRTERHAVLLDAAYLGIIRNRGGGHGHSSYRQKGRYHKHCYPLQRHLLHPASPFLSGDPSRSLCVGPPLVWPQPTSEPTCTSASSRPRVLRGKC